MKKGPMVANSLEAWSRAVRSSWGPLNTGLVEQCRCYLERLVRASTSETWLAALLRERPTSQELHRDPEHGFMLLAYGEDTEVYRPPNDHGRSWVVYAVQHGEMEMGTYGRLGTPDGGHRLVKRDSVRLSAGQAQVYLPGDIHDTLCVGGPALIFRFTERDLKIEKQQGWMTTYAQQDGVWLSRAA
jgi:hypothetical protein